MKHIAKTARKFAWLAAVLAAAFVAGCATAEQNMAEQQKLRLVPGKQIYATGPNYQFCEVGLFYGTSAENAVAVFYNPTTGTEHCSPEQFAQIEKDKAQIIKDNGARDAWLNPTRYWTWDEMWIYEVGDVKQFGPVKMAYMGVVPVAVMKQAVGAGHYHPGQISRNNKYLFKKGTTAYLLDMPDGKVLVMDQLHQQGRDGGQPQGPWQPVQAIAAGLEVSHQGARPRPDRPATSAEAPGVGDAGRIQ
jgi:hypothetical protein